MSIWEDVLTPEQARHEYLNRALREPESVAVTQNRRRGELVAVLGSELAQRHRALLAELASVKQALANEQAKPPEVVVKEVEKIVEKIVEVEKTIEVVKEVEPSWLVKVRKAILSFLKINKGGES